MYKTVGSILNTIYRLNGMWNDSSQATGIRVRAEPFEHTVQMGLGFVASFIHHRLQVFQGLIVLYLWYCFVSDHQGDVRVLSQLFSPDFGQLGGYLFFLQ